MNQSTLDDCRDVWLSKGCSVHLAKNILYAGQLIFNPCTGYRLSFSSSETKISGASDLVWEVWWTASSTWTSCDSRWWKCHLFPSCKGLNFHVQTVQWRKILTTVTKCTDKIFRIIIQNLEDYVKLKNNFNPRIQGIVSFFCRYRFFNSCFIQE